VGCLEDLRDKLVAQIAELGSTEGKEKEKKLRDLLGKQSLYLCGHLSVIL
jgi:hypothetical protein